MKNYNGTIGSLLLLLTIPVSCAKRELREGHNVFFDKGEIHRVYCPDEKCVNGKEHHKFSKSETIDAIRARYKFEFDNASKIYDKYREERADIIPLIEKYDKLMKSDIRGKLDEEIASNFKDSKFKGLLVRSTDGIVYRRELEKKKNDKGR